MSLPCVLYIPTKKVIQEENDVFPVETIIQWHTDAPVHMYNVA